MISSHEAIKLLQNNPVFFSRLGFCYDPPIKDENSRPVVFSRNFKKFADFHRDMKASGIKIHTCILHSGWVGVDEYDYSLCDEVLDALFASCGNDIYFVPRIKLNAPPAWCKENPEDTFVYYNGPREKEGIRELCDTERQDWLGYPSPHGYYQAGDYIDKRPNVDSLIGLQSFSSKKWQEDAGSALKKLLDHIENGKYGDRILGYHIAYGRCGETILWGEYGGDYGINQLKNFYDFALNKYKTKEKLNEMWGGSIDRENVPLPSPEKRYTKFNDIIDFYRGDKTDIICTDYDEFLSFSNAEAIEYFAKIVKEQTNKAVGAFYGYYMYNSFSQYAGHCAIDKILASPYIDFLASPVSYYRREVGDGGGEMTATQSVSRKKLWMSEIDIRSYLCNKNDIAVPENFEQTSSAIWREVAKALSQKSGFWLMDLGGGWYDSEKMHSLTEEIVNNTREIRKQEYKSCADVLFLTSEKGLTHSKISDRIMQSVQDLWTDARQMGFWYDSFRISDLKDLDISQYKLVVISYACEISKSEAHLIGNIKVPIAYFGAVGIIKDGKTDVKNISDLTGINVKYSKMQLFAEDEGARALRKENNLVTVAEKTVSNKKNIVCFADRFYELFDIARECGCTLHAPQGITTCGDSRFSGVFTREKEADIPFEKTATVISGQNGEKIGKFSYRIEK